MAKLYRFSKVNDRPDTQIFSILVPASSIQNAPKDVESPEFSYGYNTWNLVLRQGVTKIIGTFIRLQNAMEGVQVTVDYSIALINAEHFTNNECYSAKGVTFTLAKSSDGRKNFVSQDELTSRGFILEGDNLMFEIEMRNAFTSFEQEVQLPNESSKPVQAGGSQRYNKIDTKYLSFGGFDWNLALHPFGDCKERDGLSLVYVCRQSNFDHLCKARYKVTLGEGEQKYESEVLEQVYDTSGTGVPYQLKCSMYVFVTGRNKIKVKLELLYATAISKCNLYPMNRSKNRCNVYDREKQAWLLESDSSLDFLKFRLFYSDVINVPRKHLRRTAWNLSVVPRRGNYKAINASNGPMYHYHTQSEMDTEGIDINTNITVKEISNPASAILDIDGQMTIYIEWLGTVLIYHDTYSKLDDIDRIHKQQMLRELRLVQQENLTLEKQLHSYHVNISKKSTKSKHLDLPGPREHSSSPTAKTKHSHSSDRRGSQESRSDRSREHRKHRSHDTEDTRSVYSEGRPSKSSIQDPELTIPLYMNSVGPKYSEGTKLVDVYPSEIGEYAYGYGEYQDPASRAAVYEYYGDNAQQSPTTTGRLEPYGKEQYSKDSYSKDPYAKDAYDKDTYAKDPYPKDGITDNYYRNQYSGVQGAVYQEDYSGGGVVPPQYYPPETAAETYDAYPDQFSSPDVYDANGYGYASGAGYDGAVYPAHYHSQVVDRRPSSGWNGDTNGSRWPKGRDQHSDDGYYSAPSLNQDPTALPTPNSGVIPRSHSPYNPLERVSSSERRSPNLRSKHGKSSPIPPELVPTYHDGYQPAIPASPHMSVFARKESKRHSVRTRKPPP